MTHHGRTSFAYYVWKIILQYGFNLCSAIFYSKWTYRFNTRKSSSWWSSIPPPPSSSLSSSQCSRSYVRSHFLLKYNNIISAQKDDDTNAKSLEIFLCWSLDGWMGVCVCVCVCERKPVNLRALACIRTLLLIFFDLFYLVCTFNSLHVLAHSWNWSYVL